METSIKGLLELICQREIELDVSAGDPGSDRVILSAFYIYPAKEGKSPNRSRILSIEMNAREAEMLSLTLDRTRRYASKYRRG
jgi:hypothetical protein